MEQVQSPSSNYTYSRTRIENLGATEYTLVTIVNDVSGSTATFQAEMEKTNAAIVEACRHSPRADNLLLRQLVFSTQVYPDTQRGHGFKLLANINPGDYTGMLAPDDLTALYDATLDAVEVTIANAEDLRKNDFEVNAAIFIQTDGLNNASTHTMKSIAAAIKRARQNEVLQSVLTVLIGINVSDPDIKRELEKFQKEAGLDQFVAVADATPRTLAKVAQFVSKSISSSSQALATKGPSVPINPSSIGI
jgi:hypothetical protein